MKMLLLTVMLAAVGAPQAQEPRLDTGPRLLQPFKQNLERALKTGLAATPAQAVAACRLEAPAIADALAVDDVRLGRTSDRLRSPANVSPAWVLPLLREYLHEPSARTARTVSLDNGRAGYVEPILVQPLCLNCHGTTLVPPVAERIAELYPNDRATGYQAGDLRGVFWVEYPRRP